MIFSASVAFSIANSGPPVHCPAVVGAASEQGQAHVPLLDGIITQQAVIIAQRARHVARVCQMAFEAGQHRHVDGLLDHVGDPAEGRARGTRP